MAPGEPDALGSQIWTVVEFRLRPDERPNIDSMLIFIGRLSAAGVRARIHPKRSGKALLLKGAFIGEHLENALCLKTSRFSVRLATADEVESLKGGWGGSDEQ